MPGNIEIQEPSLVMPMTLASIFTETVFLDATVDEYMDGRSTRRALATFPRHSFTITRPLLDSQLDDLRGFYFNYARYGRTFWFYNQRETIPPGSYDPTGEDLTGRYAVVWEGGWSETLNLGLAVAGIALREVRGGGSVVAAEIER
jgi:hypothetical protein